jgi:hypothetical protein
VEALADAVSLRALGLGPRVIDVLDRKVKLIFVSLRVATILAAAVGQYAQKLDVVLLEQRQHPIIEQICRRDRCLAVIELGAKASFKGGLSDALASSAPSRADAAGSMKS